MRATGQVASINGQLSESERRLVTARAILGEWLGGSGGGGKIPAVCGGDQIIQGAQSTQDDPSSVSVVVG